MAERGGWEPSENTGLVAAYMAAWEAEQSGAGNSMALFFKIARSQVDTRRTDSALRRKANNVSAALDEARLPYYPRFRPEAHRQRSLDAVVFNALTGRDATEVLQRIAARPVSPNESDTPMLETPPPAPAQSAAQRNGPRKRVATQTDYGEVEANNRSLGQAGEQLAAEYYRHTLRAAGRDDLAQRVEHIAATQGDGLGYDLIAYEPDGSVLHVEVKTTRGTVTRPFFISAAEVAASDELAASYRLMRIYDYRAPTGTKFYTLPGPVREFFNLTPTTFSAFPTAK